MSEKSSQQEFGLRANPGLEARRFLEGKFEALQEAGPENLERLKEETRLILGGLFDKLKKDSRFVQIFLDPRENVRGEQTGLGETLQGALTFLDAWFSERLAAASGPEERRAVLEEHYRSRLSALERFFAGDLSVFQHYFILIFLRYTQQQREFSDEELEAFRERFRVFLDERDTMLRFFFYLDEFNLSNTERVKLDLAKKGSLSQRLEEQIHHGEPVAGLERQIFLCDRLRALGARLVEISRDQHPLDEIRRVIDEVYTAEAGQNVVKGLLEKFRGYYRFELELLRDSLVFKQVMLMNSGAKVGREHRKAWLESWDLATVERLTALLEIREAPNQRLSQEQRAQLELFHQLKPRLDEARAKAVTAHPLEDGELNLLVHRLSNTAQLEEQITQMEQRLEGFHRQNNVLYQSGVIRPYNERFGRLVQSLYYYIELYAFLQPPLERKAREIAALVREEIAGLEAALRGEAAPAAIAPDAPGVACAPGEAAAGPEAKPDRKALEQQQKELRRRLEEERDPEARAVLLAEGLKFLPDQARVKHLKELAYFGNLESLRHILPLSQYAGSFLRNLARNTVIKIVLRVLRQNEETAVLGIQQKKKLIDLVAGLDKKYSYLREMELSNPRTTLTIYDILIREDSEFTARALAEILADEDSQVRATAVRIIADMLNQNEMGLLMKLLNDPDDRVRANVIESLEAAGNRNVLGILMKYKFDKNNRVRANTIKAIWKFGHKDVNDALQEMLLDQDHLMRSSAVWVIGEIGHFQPRLKALLKAVQSDKHEMVQDNLRRAGSKISRREQGLLVLVADDDIAFCQELCRGLKRDGFRAAAVFNGRAALNAVEKSVPDVIFLDLRMPLANGLEVLKSLREKPETSEVPVIVMSDLNSSILLKQATRAGANDYLLKPCSYLQLKEKLQQYA